MCRRDPLDSFDSLGPSDQRTRSGSGLPLTPSLVHAPPVDEHPNQKADDQASADDVVGRDDELWARLGRYIHERLGPAAPPCGLGAAEAFALVVGPIKVDIFVRCAPRGPPVPVYDV